MTQDKKQELIREIVGIGFWPYIEKRLDTYMNNGELSPKDFFFYQMGWIVTFTEYTHIEAGERRIFRQLAGLSHLTYSLDAPQGHLPLILEAGWPGYEEEEIRERMSKITRKYSNYHPPVGFFSQHDNSNIEITIAFLERLESCKD